LAEMKTAFKEKYPEFIATQLWTVLRTQACRFHPILEQE
jgi:hypothetical protein